MVPDGREAWPLRIAPAAVSHEKSRLDACRGAEVSAVAWSVDDNRPARVHRRAGAAHHAAHCVIRRLGLEHNQLHRPSDRVETGVRIVLTVVAVLAMPLAVATGILVFGRLEAVAAHGAATRHPVPATVLGDPRAMSLPGRSVAVTTAQVSWVVPGHGRRTGTAVVPADARRGDPTRVWVTDQGDLISAPAGRSEASALAVLAGTSVLLSLLGFVALSLAGARRLLDRGRFRAWEEAWERFDAARRR